MGCDIHLHVEIKKKEHEWQMATKELTLHDWREKAVLDQPWYSDRNYALFGILAGVRSNDIEPIAQPRGIPDDVSYEVDKEKSGYGVDGHSHSYLTLAELLAYNWDQILWNLTDVWVPEKEYSEAQQEGRNPESWVDYDLSKIAPDEKFVKTSFSITAREAAGKEFMEFIQELEKLARQLRITSEHADGRHRPDPNRVRIVFWFDN
jgi:hypothetical protein